jgi:hypothetical protein
MIREIERGGRVWFRVMLTKGLEMRGGSLSWLGEVPSRLLKGSMGLEGLIGMGMRLLISSSEKIGQEREMEAYIAW